LLPWVFALREIKERWLTLLGYLFLD
jgi:hypothetical protein